MNVADVGGAADADGTGDVDDLADVGDAGGARDAGKGGNEEEEESILSVFVLFVAFADGLLEEPMTGFRKAHILHWLDRCELSKVQREHIHVELIVQMTVN